MSALIVRRFIEGDIPSATSILDLAFGPSPWPTALRRNLLIQPEGLFLAERDGQALGVIGAVNYGPFAYIGLLGVHPSARRQGIARTLMNTVLQWLDDSGCPLSLLDASDDGAPLYVQLGFVDVGTSYLTICTEAAVATPLPNDVTRLEPHDLDALTAFDTAIFGADRRILLAHLTAIYPERTLVMRDQTGAISGYMIAQTRSLGPWVARTSEIAVRLLQAGLACGFTVPPRVFVSGENQDVLALVVAAGLKIDHPLRHMQRGQRPRPGNCSASYGLTSFALG
ncbi:MAG: GNAT family N-acetyltransferase [Oscillochloris sp.]|nr:GNAT family N-acetyltransferase [Oscillochloris sp.]